jgi:Ser/Thr protein kinase RdoA (MazF antagonist)
LSCAKRYAQYTEDPALFDGDALLHTDLNPDNVLVDSTAHLIDWAWPTRGPAWADPAVWVVRLIDAGHSPEQAEAWAAELPAWGEAPPAAVTCFARANAELWEDIAVQNPVEWQKSMSVSARLWADYRTSRSSATTRVPEV